MTVKERSWKSFENLPAQAENVAVEGGALCCGVGAKALAVSDGKQRRVAYFADEKVWFALTEGLFLARKGKNDSSFVAVNGVPLGDGGFARLCLDGENEYLVFAGASGVYLLSLAGEVETVYAGRALPYAKEFHDRLFFALPNAVVAYGEVGQVGGWVSSADGAGKIELANGGEIVGLAVLKERLYVFCRRGIARLDVRGAGRDFTVEYLPYGGGDLVAYSACECGNYVCFLSADGVYRFDGSSAEKVARLPDGWNGQSEVQAGADEGYYYLSYEADGTRKTFALNAEEKTVYYAFGVEALTQGYDGCYCVADGALSRLVKGGVAKGARRFFVAARDFGVKKEKTAVGVRVFGTGAVTVALTGERGRQETRVSLAGGVGEGRLALKGKLFDVEIGLDDGARVDGVTFLFEEVRV